VAKKTDIVGPRKAGAKKAASRPVEPETADTGRYTYADLCAALNATKDITEAALALGYGKGDRKSARDSFQMAFRRLASASGAEPRAGQYLRTKFPSPDDKTVARIRVVGQRVRKRGRRTAEEYRIDANAHDLWTRAVARAKAEGAKDGSDIVGAIARAFLAR